jgi:hypothetical protein
MSRLRFESRGIAGLCLLLAVIHTWPLVTAPGTLSRNDNADAELNEWILAWVAHQLPRDPSRLFDGNMFYPERDTLAYSEPLIVPALMGAPMQWLGASPVLVFNIVLVLGFALTAYAGYALVHAWTGDRAAGLLAGSLFAFNTHTLTRIAHVQGIHAWGLPLTLLSADRLIVHGRWRDAIWLAVWMSAMAYTSGYLVVFGAFIVAVAVLARVADWRARAVRVIALFGVSTVLAAVAILPVYLPYRRLGRTMGMNRPLEAVAEFSASVTGYLATAGRIHWSTWSSRFVGNPVDLFFPGVTVVVLAVLAIYWALMPRRPDAASAQPALPAFSIRSVLTRRRIVMLLAIGAIGFVLSLGLRTPVYGWAYHVFPPMQGLRAAARFGNLFLLAIAALAGLGLAAARTRLPPRRAGLIAAGLVTLVNLESLRAPVGYTTFEGIPAIYSILAEEPGRVVLVEVPFWPPQGAFEQAEYVLNSTAHWRPMLNGYSGYLPQSYRKNAELFWFFPQEHAIQAMRRAGATHVIVHPKGFGHEAEAMWRTVADSPYLERIATTPGGPALYRLR